jgi:hypothetical protein
MKHFFLLLLIVAVSTAGYTQNVGIGTSNPTRAKLEVHGVVGATSAIFGGESSGISLQRNYPGIGYNEYYNNGSKHIGDGYAGKTSLDPATGVFALDLFQNGSANGVINSSRRLFAFLPNGEGLIGSNYYNANLVVSRGNDQQATACFFGDTYHSFFNHDVAQNTYIRAGKVNGKVVINDIPGSTIIMSGNVGINTATPGVALEIYQTGTPNIGGLSLVAPTTYNSWQMYADPSPNESFFLCHRYTAVGFFDAVDGGYHNYSDARLKNHIETLPGVLDKVMALRPVEYEMVRSNPHHKKSIGFIAQEVKNYFPGLVTVTKDSLPGMGNLENVHSINYSAFGVIAIKAIQEQQVLITQLQADVAALMQSDKDLMKRIEKAEAARKMQVQHKTGQ